MFDLFITTKMNKLFIQAAFGFWIFLLNNLTTSLLYSYL